MTPGSKATETRANKEDTESTELDKLRKELERLQRDYEETNAFALLAVPQCQRNEKMQQSIYQLPSHWVDQKDRIDAVLKKVWFGHLPLLVGSFRSLQYYPQRSTGSVSLRSH